MIASAPTILIRRGSNGRDYESNMSTNRMTGGQRLTFTSGAGHDMPPGGEYMQYRPTPPRERRKFRRASHVLFKVRSLRLERCARFVLEPCGYTEAWSQERILRVEVATTHLHLRQRSSKESARDPVFAVASGQQVALRDTEERPRRWLSR